MATMKSLILHDGWRWPWMMRASSALRLILLVALRERAQSISLEATGNETLLSLYHKDHAEPLIPPPTHLVYRLAVEIRSLSGLRQRSVDAWDRWHGRVFPERVGHARLLLGSTSAQLSFWMLPYPDGVFIDLKLNPEPGAPEKAVAILHRLSQRHAQL